MLPRKLPRTPRQRQYCRTLCLRSLSHAKLSLHTVTRAFRSLIQKTLCATCLPIQSAGGDERNRTDDPLLAKQVLSQLSYTPIFN